MTRPARERVQIDRTPAPFSILHGDCVERMSKLPAAYFDALVTDPPYGLEFMSKKWDKLDGDVSPGYSERPRFRGETSAAKNHPGHGNVPNFYVAGSKSQQWHEQWARAALRVLKPGGFLVAFGGTRTFHRLTCAIEDAGFEIRDGLMWLYGSGFPKSMDVSKAIDKAAGAERQRVGALRGSGYTKGNVQHGAQERDTWEWAKVSDVAITDAAKLFAGFGTALKPAWEPIILARKPISESTVAANVLKWGTGALNIDGTRIVGGDPANLSRLGKSCGDAESATFHQVGHAVVGGSLLGRWPANFLLAHDERCVHVGTREIKSSNAHEPADGFEQKHSVYADRKTLGRVAGFAIDGKETVDEYACVPDCPVRLLDSQTGIQKSGKPVLDDMTYADTGGASRFFYTAKADSSERWELCRTCDVIKPRKNLRACHDAKHDLYAHPTVKPVDLMRYLIRLVAPLGSLILDPFAGTATTLDAARLEGIDAIGIEQDAINVRICRERLS